jgi:hypothetical protein
VAPLPQVYFKTTPMPRDPDPPVKRWDAFNKDSMVDDAEVASAFEREGLRVLDAFLLTKDLRRMERGSGGCCYHDLMHPKIEVRAGALSLCLWDAEGVCPPTGEGHTASSRAGNSAPL